MECGRLFTLSGAEGLVLSLEGALFSYGSRFVLCHPKTTKTRPLESIGYELQTL
jgi:hypothetical protein